MIAKILNTAVTALIVGALASVALSLFRQGYYPGAIVVAAAASIMFALGISALFERAEGGQRDELILAQHMLYDQPLFTYMWIKVFGKTTVVSDTADDVVISGKRYDNRLFITKTVFKLKPEFVVETESGKKVEFVSPLAPLTDVVKAKLFGEYVELTNENVTMIGGTYKGIMYVFDAWTDEQ